MRRVASTGFVSRYGVTPVEAAARAGSGIWQNEVSTSRSTTTPSDGNVGSIWASPESPGMGGDETTWARQPVVAVEADRSLEPFTY